jgi:hypothetical protein
MSEPIQNRNRGQMKAKRPHAFDIVKELGCSLPNVEVTTRYDGSPVLKVNGVFLAGMAIHASAEADTLVVRAEFEEREGFLADAPETYYVTDYYRRYPLVLVRLSLLEREELRELLAGSLRMAAAKCRKGRPTPTKIPSALQSGGIGPS